MTKLQIPCAYQGGKQRVAKDIVDIIYKENDINDDTVFYDLCCGSGAISIELVNRGFNPSNVVMLDKSVWGLFWKKIGNGEFSTDVFKLYIEDIPKDITKIKDYAKEMLTKPANDGLFDNAVYKFLILQACAFGATATWIENNEWRKAGGLRNYWLPTETSNRKSPVNPMMPMPDSLFNRVELITNEMYGVKGINDDIRTLTEFEGNSIIYIDPPYDSTTGYGYSFDVLDYIKKIGKKCYVSEGKKMTDKAYLISSGRSKGGISGERKKKANEEWLNIFE